MTEQVKSLPLPPGAFMTPDHRYYWNGQGPVPSVTTVLGIMDKPAVGVWKAKETARAILTDPEAYVVAPDDPTYLTGMEDRIRAAVGKADEARDKAASLGSSVHLLADIEGLRGHPTASRASETPDKGFQVSDDTIPYLEAYKGFMAFLEAQGGSIVSSEHVVWSLNGYAGTYDLIVQMPHQELREAMPGEPLPNADDLWLLDIKTSRMYYPEYGLQLAGYRWADSIILPNDPTAYSMPEIQRTGVLHLRPDTYGDTGWRLIEYPTTYEKDFMAFLAALELYRWKTEGRFTKSNLTSKP